MKDTQKSIREEFRKQYPDCTTGEGRCIDCSDKNDIENFFLAKFSALLQTIESEIEGKREKYWISKTESIEELSDQIGKDGYNQGLDSAKAIISNKHKNLWQNGQ